MVGEQTVRLEELAASYICAESLKNICGIEASCAVACINNDLKALERMMIVLLGIDLSLDKLTEISCVIGHIISLGKSAFSARLRLAALLSCFEDGSDIIALKTALAGKEFEAVSVIGVVTCSDLNCAVAAEIDSSHEHCRCRAHIAVSDLDPCSEQCGLDIACNTGTGYP